MYIAVKKGKNTVKGVDGMRGCERKIIMLKGTNSEIFDEAYFLIRRDLKTESHTGEIVREAQRIVDMNTTHRNVRKRSAGETFALGALIGALFGICATLVFAAIF